MADSPTSPASVSSPSHVTRPLIIVPTQKPSQEGNSGHHPHPYKGFVAGVFSGATKLTVGHPFDTLKVRLQTSPPSQFKGPIDCLSKTLRNEGFRGLYKGATPPLVGWMFMDSIMLGSLTTYQTLLKKHYYGEARLRPDGSLPIFGAGMAGIGAGLTVSFIAAPVEHVKARLQVQYHDARKHHVKVGSPSNIFYTGPIDCIKKLIRTSGFPGLYHGLLATLLFRSHFFVWWSTYSTLTDYLKQNTSLSTPSINFWAGGLSAQCFWLTSYPFDVVKQRIMTDKLAINSYASSKPLLQRGYNGGDKYGKSWWRAVKGVYADDVGTGKNGGVKAFWRGFGPCFLRAFPANAMALVAFEAVMRGLPG